MNDYSSSMVTVAILRWLRASADVASMRSTSVWIANFARYGTVISGTGGPRLPRIANVYAAERPISGLTAAEKALLRAKYWTVTEYAVHTVPSAGGEIEYSRRAKTASDWHVARVMGIPEATLRKRLARARKKVLVALKSC